jgi:hypothetical protein
VKTRTLAPTEQQNIEQQNNEQRTTEQLKNERRPTLCSGAPFPVVPNNKLFRMMRCNKAPDHFSNIQSVLPVTYFLSSLLDGNRLGKQINVVEGLPITMDSLNSK